MHSALGDFLEPIPLVVALGPASQHSLGLLTAFTLKFSFFQKLLYGLTDVIQLFKTLLGKQFPCNEMNSETCIAKACMYGVTSFDWYTKQNCLTHALQRSPISEALLTHAALTNPK